ncbi:CAP domain-containing protein [Chitinibacter bivalviorum]|uniref:CAP domain-containing protein n=1 Tax=Chitinibacter bivalviorum TaxID=2739434 RepID=A0A7H9BID6_9NEIS|nr:CAP domain-containing protein [Chitinibacter bivalviorum]QLG88397.1 CAP domain-containing protein [Chitinibacter bivalviorum]
MTEIKRLYSIGVFSFALLLVACGGGSGGNNSSTSGNSSQPPQQSSNNLCTEIPPSTSNAVILKAAAGPSANGFQSTGDNIGDLNQYTNAIRAELSLPALTVEPALNLSAGQHSSYMQLNEILSHDEIPGNIGFTAATPFERIQQVYDPPLSFSGEIASAMSGSGTSASRAIADLFDAPLHRVIMLSEYLAMGSGYAVSSKGVAYSTQDFANYRAGISDFELVAYPYAGATQIRSYWQDSETPDPLGGTPYSHKNVGYPISLQGNFGSELTLTQLKVYANCSSEIAVTARDHSSSPQIVETSNVIIAVPHTPLAPRTNYTVWATGQYLSASKELRTFDLRWSFTTQ